MFNRIIRQMANNPIFNFHQIDKGRGIWHNAKKKGGFRMEKEQISRLVERFGKDVTCDKDLLRTRFINSLARQELCKLGQEALRPIISHLRANPPSEPVVAQAFCNLFYCLEEKVDPCATATKSLIDLRGWLEWAEKFADAE